MMVVDKIIFILALFLYLVIMARAECVQNTALDMDTLKCVDMNLTLNPKWIEFYMYEK